MSHSMFTLGIDAQKDSKFGPINILSKSRTFSVLCFDEYLVSKMLMCILFDLQSLWSPLAAIILSIKTIECFGLTSLCDRAIQYSMIEIVRLTISGSYHDTAIALKYIILIISFSLIIIVISLTCLSWVSRPSWLYSEFPQENTSPWSYDKIQKKIHDQDRYRWINGWDQ